jgi:hypothetical protein
MDGKKSRLREVEGNDRHPDKNVLHKRFAAGAARRRIRSFHSD